MYYLLYRGGAYADITFEPSCTPGDVSIDTLFVEGTEYHSLSVEGFPLPMDGVQNAGLPSVPFTAPTFLLPPDIQIDSIQIISANWDTLPGKYYLYPAQTGIMTDTTFTPPDSTVYNSDEPFPARPVEVMRQGSAMGYSVVSLSGTPVRYIPADSTLMILTSVTLGIQTGPSEAERIVPNRETEWSAAMRERGILSLISNPGDLACYPQPMTMSFENRTSPLNITQSPSPEGDGVDMVIITSNELAADFEQVSDYRTQQGIITVIRTVEWIDQFYSGCDTPERMRNFIRDAHEEWGIQAVLLGGDDGVVPVRECKGWFYYYDPVSHDYQLPSDDYYADIDGNWSNISWRWYAEETDHYLDLCAGRWPVDDGDDVDLIFAKLKLYEWPENFPEGFARKLLLAGSDAGYLDGATRMIELCSQLEESGAIPEYLDDPTELYYLDTTPPSGDLCRNTALYEFDQGYGLIIHADHSDVHEIGTAGIDALWQVMWGSDFATMSNFNEPSILLTLGCDPGHFDGADCFAEAGLLTSSGSGLVAVIANSRIGIKLQYKTYYTFCDALFNTGWIAEQQPGVLFIHWPLSYLGEAHRCSKNHDYGPLNLRLNLLGAPLMYVWRDDPGALSVSVPPIFLREGVPRDITVTVTDGIDPVENATVCLWKKDEIFSVEETNAQGQVTFADVCIADGSGDQDVVITAVKRRRQEIQGGTTVVSYIPDQVTLDVLPARIPIVSLQDYSVDANGDGTANPGETVDIYLTAKNSGGETALNVTAELSLVSGGEYIESIPDNQADFPDIGQDQTEDSTDPFTIVVNSNVESYSIVEFSVTFSYDGSSGSHQWESPLFLSIYSEGYDLTVVHPTADNSGGITAEIILTNMFLANCGLGEGCDLEITADNLFPSEPFQVNTLTHPGIESNEVAGLIRQIELTVNASLGSDWLQEGFPGCSFDVVVSSDGGDFIARNVDVALVDELQDLQLNPPSDLQAYEAGQDYISLVWNHDGDVAAEGFYVYCDDGIERYRVYPLPVPVEQATIEGLLPGREYNIEVTAVDAIGRESDPVSEPISTTCPAVDGWPIQLAGSPGGGAAIADIDQDGSDEIIVATVFGVVYLIERDGSYQTLSPPPGYDFDRFLGCAVGDVDGDSHLEIVVSCQKKIEVQGEEQVAVLLFDRSGVIWTGSEIATTEVNEEVASPYVAGTPVLFQADGGGYMEIALRTRGNFDNGGNPHLYAWRYDSGSGSWVDYSNDFPVNLSGDFYNAPTAVDFDGDGFEELIVTTYGSGRVGTALKIIDFESDGNVVITVHDLPELDTEGETARAFGTLAAAEEDRTYYLAGSAKKDVSSGKKKVFVYRLETDPEVDVSFVWQTGWMTGRYYCSNMPGPAIGDLDGNNDLEVFYTLNSGQYDREGIVCGWDLGDGTVEFQSDYIPYNPVIGYGEYIKSQPVVGLTTSQGSGAMAIFSGFSSLCCGHDPQSDSSMLEGFPAWTRDGAWAAPAICDLDSDGYAEVLHIDYSGFATLFDWDEGYYTGNGWHMYQDNPFRNGFYNTGNRGVGLDISISGRPYMAAQKSIYSRGFCLIAEVEITGTGCLPFEEQIPATMSAVAGDIGQVDLAPIPVEGIAMENMNVSRTRTHDNRVDRSSISTTVTPVTLYRTVEIAAFCGDMPLGSAIVLLEEGTHMVEIPLRSQSRLEGDITVVADPFNEYTETDETNNVSSAENVSIAGNVPEVFIPSPAEAIELSINLPSSLPEGISIRIYSIDGRLVTSLDTEELHSGLTTLLPGTCNGTARLPAGMYTVCIEGLDGGETVRKVIILGY